MHAAKAAKRDSRLPTDLSVQSWLDHLRCLLPVVGVVYAGAGNGVAASAYCAAWGAAAVFVEADAAQYDKLAAALQGHPGWSCHAALLAGCAGQQDFFLASNPHESGVIPPENLVGLWRNLKTIERRPLDAVPLATLLAKFGHAPHSFNWAVIDCLPALPVIQGAGLYLDAWDVIIARVILDERQLPGIGATKPELDIFLTAHGFHCLACQAERQPAVGSALYVRDWKAAFGRQLAEPADELQRQIEQLTLSRDGYAQLAVELQAELERLARQSEDGQNPVSGEDEATAQIKAELEQARQAAKLAQKLQLLRESDLRDLRQQYREMVMAQQRQRQIVADLEQRLRTALAYFRQMRESTGQPSPPFRRIAKADEAGKG